jgi:hypothetical protein
MQTSINGRERVRRAMAHQLPDRVPVTLFIADQGHFLSQIYPDVDPWDFDTLHMKVIELQREPNRKKVKSIDADAKSATQNTQKTDRPAEKEVKKGT